MIYISHVARQACGIISTAVTDWKATRGTSADTHISKTRMNMNTVVNRYLFQALCIPHMQKCQLTALQQPSRKFLREAFILIKEGDFAVMLWPNLCIIDPIRSAHPARYTRNSTIGRVFSFFWNVWKLNGNCYFILSPNRNAFSACKVH